MDIKSDEEKLKELFEMKEKPNFNNAVKRAKIFSIVRTIIISLMMFIIVSFVLFISNGAILNVMNNKEEDSLRTLFDVAMPNAYIGSIQIDDRIMIGEIDYVRYRFLKNKPIIDGNYKESYTYIPLINGVYGYMGQYLFDRVSKSSRDSNEAYNKVGKKVMKFYHPSIKYENYINDLENIDEIGSDKLMEISLSFDKSYSLEEVKNMLPSDITLNWYWVDTFSENDYYFSDKLIFNEYYVYGIKALDNQGDSIDNPEKNFIDAINEGKDNNYSNEYKELFDNLSNGKGEINKEDLKIIGVVVSGDSKSLKALKDKTYIKAATLGAVADKY
ncbi:anti sigma factor C-terminal domain-containing protein [Clostridium aquiflavi]|uniref:Anti sigma factor C-terminal domain-containing protein n=1 Tax=Clostridium aquiflavi TaxID=3073603 RepID=A0ABU1EEG3_9CLOT|nr:anti sigma factor C-terminal domain-containing protein [Clostridium sp. 5N-1]MDR5586780.1 anti sigma factor C-terminal domain-containing protein [Clostridium sp. 5N-1]